MATYLTKALHRAALLNDREYIVSLLPPDEVYRFPRLQFRKKGARKAKYWLPLEAALNEAAKRWAGLASKEKKRLRKERHSLRKQGLL